jgi:hypothetical protein
MKLTIPAVPPSPNRVLGHHWKMKNGEKNKWILLIRSQILPGRALEQRKRVKIVFVHSRWYDQDNAYAAAKPLVDALKHWNLIWDDSAEWIDLMISQETCPHKQRYTIIELEAL